MVEVRTVDPSPAGPPGRRRRATLGKAELRFPAALVVAVACTSSPPTQDGQGGGSDETSAASESDPTAPGEGVDDGPDDGADDAPPGTGDGPADTDTGGEDTGGEESTGAEEQLVPIFIAQGNIGRTVISCDDGHTWVGDRDWEGTDDPLLCGMTDPVRCWEQPCTFLSGDACIESAPECDCGHHPGFAKGIAYGDGWFVATWGWGHSGRVMRSRDGVQWEETLTDVVTFGGIAYGAGTFVLSNRYPQYSPDGAAWTLGEEADFRGPGGEIVWSVRRFAAIDYDGEPRFVATASPPQDVLVTSDGGQTWWEPSVLPEACLTEMSTYGGIASADGVVVGVGQGGVACRSTDGGDTWTESSVGGDNILGHLVHDGTQYVTWAPGVRYSSPDGETWEATPLTPEGIWIGPAAYNEATGSYVAITRVWDAYEAQTMVRSDDGIEWQTVEAPAFVGGHPIFDIEFGWAEPSESCPAR